MNLRNPWRLNISPHLMNCIPSSIVVSKLSLFFFFVSCLLQFCKFYSSPRCFFSYGVAFWILAMPISCFCNFFSWKELSFGKMSVFYDLGIVPFCWIFGDCENGVFLCSRLRCLISTWAFQLLAGWKIDLCCVCNSGFLSMLGYAQCVW